MPMIRNHRDAGAGTSQAKADTLSPEATVAAILATLEQIPGLSPKDAAVARAVFQQAAPQIMTSEDAMVARAVFKQAAAEITSFT